MEINEKEILRYLGYGRNAADEAVMKMVHECIDDVRQYASPKSVSARFSLELGDDFHVKMAGINVRSKSLTKNLADCSEVIFFCATLGTDIDRIFNRYQRLNIAKAAVFQATAAAAVEGYCNECQKKIEERMLEEGLFVRPRFSPGYGDLPLSIQGKFLDALNARKNIGVFLSEGDIMMPEKSVSAVMGLSRVNSRCHIEGCEACTNTGCAYRRC